MYQMWNGNIDNIRDSIWYSKHFSVKPSVEPFSFNTAKRGVVSSFKIEELDLLTSGCHDEEDFRQQLLDYGNTYIDNNSDFNIVITHNYRGSIREDDVIYNDKLVYMCAMEKNQLYSNTAKYTLSSNEILLDFINYLKFIVLDPVTRNYILDPYKIKSKILPEDRYKLECFAKEDILDSNDCIVHKELKSLFKNYINAYDNNQHCIKYSDSSLESEIILDNCEKKLNCYFRKNYRNLRNAIVWDNNFRNVLSYQIKNSEDFVEKARFQNILSISIKQKLYRNGKITKDELDHQYDLYEQNNFYSLDKINPECLENEDIRSLYQEGGTDLIRTRIDIEDIYGFRYHDDMVKLGIIKGKVK